MSLSLSLKNIQCNNRFKEQALVFDQTGHVEKLSLVHAGEQALVSLYGGDGEVGLNMLRYRRFCEKISSSYSHVQPHVLPPTTAAAMYHSLRVYKQIMDWKGCGDELNPEEWGWQVIAGRCIPVMTDQPPAPPELLQLFRCNCKEHYNTSRCTCRKHGLQCSAACGECRGTSCANTPKPDFDV